MKRSEMLVVPLRDQNLVFWTALGAKYQTVTLMLTRYSLGAPVSVKRTFRFRFRMLLFLVPFRGQTELEARPS